jgi:putative acetyltransferase
MQQITLRAMQPADYPALWALWHATEGMHLNESDEEGPFVQCLARNPGLSAVAVGADGGLAGGVLCTFDGRSGYLHHLAVTPALRGSGIARALIDFSLDRLAENGVMRCNIFILADNAPGQSFWQHNGWTERPWRIMQHPLPRAAANA